jgi:uncharacterized membrane protein
MSTAVNGSGIILGITLLSGFQQINYHLSHVMWSIVVTLLVTSDFPSLPWHNVTSSSFDQALRTGLQLPSHCCVAFDKSTTTSPAMWSTEQ